MDGVLVIDKPKGPTSHDVVQTVKNLVGAEKVGHLGTLDPAATGVLPLVINGATKHAAHLAGVEKTYEFTLRLGIVTETDDDTGKVISESSIDKGLLAKLEEILPRFTGRIMQRPPKFSAVKVNGRRSYKLARGGRDVEPAPRQVQVDTLCITGGSPPNVNMKVECRSGTYVRSLCRDLGEDLGCGGHAADIRRLRSGDYTIDKAISLDELVKNPDIWRSAILRTDCSGS